MGVLQPCPPPPVLQGPQRHCHQSASTSRVPPLVHGGSSHSRMALSSRGHGYGDALRAPRAPHRLLHHRQRPALVTVVAAGREGKVHWTLGVGWTGSAHPLVLHATRCAAKTVLRARPDTRTSVRDTRTSLPPRNGRFAVCCTVSSTKTTTATSAHLLYGHKHLFRPFRASGEGGRRLCPCHTVFSDVQRAAAPFRTHGITRRCPYPVMQRAQGR